MGLQITAIEVASKPEIVDADLLSLRKQPRIPIYRVDSEQRMKLIEGLW